MANIIKLGKVCLSIFYAILKLFPTKPNKVLFLSRQSDELSLDFAMLKKELQRQNNDVYIVEICNRVDDQHRGLAKFAIDILRSMYHLATSEVCVLDAYWPTVSILHHKDSLTVIQMWHALGKIKKSGYQTLGKVSGRSEKMSKLLCMHENYDYIVAGGEAWNSYYCQSFNTTEDKLLNIGLPRIDHLLETEEQNKKTVLEAYPALAEKEVILYAPTFRRNMKMDWESLYHAIDLNRYHLIIKEHPNQKLGCNVDGVFTCPEFETVDLLAVCDYLITDYSAIAIEGAILNKKTYYYLFDFDAYIENNGVNVSPFDSMPGCAFTDAETLFDCLQAGAYPQDVLDKYRKKFLPKALGTSTKKLADVVMKHLHER